MGTNADIARVRDDGLIDTIRIAYDGYLTGVGMELYRYYDTPEKVAALFGHTEYATSIEPDPVDMDWQDHEMETRDQTLETFSAAHGYEGVDEREMPGDMRLYIHAHGKWSAPRGWQTAKAFIETGEGDVITRELLIEGGAKDKDFTWDPRRPANEHTGVLSVELVPGNTQECILRLTDDRGNVYDVFPGPGFTGVEGAPEMKDARDLQGLHVVVRSTSIAVSSSFGIEGVKSRSVMGAKSIVVVQPATDGTQGEAN